jgi:ATP-dependent Zn protease
MDESPDFIATELLRELKESNARKDARIMQLQRHFFVALISCLASILMVVGICFWYLNQYDFTGGNTETTSATGVYALIDSEGNVIGTDLTPEEVEGIVNGNSNENNYNVQNAD